MKHHQKTKDDDGPFVAILIAAVLVLVFLSILIKATK